MQWGCMGISVSEIEVSRLNKHTSCRWVANSVLPLVYGRNNIAGGVRPHRQCKAEQFNSNRVLVEAT